MTAVLAIHAHPDDIETLCAGSLALLAQGGCRVTIATATAGEGGSAELPPEAIGPIRRAEAARAATMIGAEYRCLGLPDLGVFNDDPSRRAMTELLRAVRPDLVITASPVDYHPDHEAVSALVRDACFAAPVGNYRTGEAAALGAIPHLYFTDPIGGRDRALARVEPEFGADIGAVMDTKRAMLMAHESQHAWVAKQHGIADHLASLDACGRRCGRVFGVEFAEGFRQYRLHPYPTTPLLQDLLGAALVQPLPRAAS